MIQDLVGFSRDHLCHPIFLRLLLSTILSRIASNSSRQLPSSSLFCVFCYLFVFHLPQRPSEFLEPHRCVDSCSACVSMLILTRHHDRTVSSRIARCQANIRCTRLSTKSSRWAHSQSNDNSIILMRLQMDTILPATLSQSDVRVSLLPSTCRNCRSPENMLVGVRV